MNIELTKVLNPHFWDKTEKPSLDSNFWKKVKKTDGCWIWQAGTNTNGYGVFKVDKKCQLSHRVAYELHYNIKLKPKNFLYHKCNNNLCCNPQHLTLEKPNYLSKVTKIINIKKPFVSKVQKRNNVTYRNRGIKEFLNVKFSDTKTRAKLRGLKFSLQKNDLSNMLFQQKGKCYYCGRTMSMIAGKGTLEDTITIDRIDSAKGYTSCNCRLACCTCNIAKHTSSSDKFLEMCKTIVENHCLK